MAYQELKFYALFLFSVGGAGGDFLTIYSTFLSMGENSTLIVVALKLEFKRRIALRIGIEKRLGGYLETYHQNGKYLEIN